MRTPVLLIAGQSNAVGTSVTGDLDGYTFSNVKIYQDGEFTGGNERLKNAWLNGIKPGMGYTPAHSGIELGICSALRDVGSYAIIRYAYGTTDLINGWRAESLWEKEPVVPSDAGYYFREFKNTFFRAQKSFGAPVKTVGLAFMQGESDAYNREGAEKYADNLAAFVKDAREFTGEKSLPVFVGEIATRVSEYAPYADRIRRAQREYCSADENAYLIESYDLSLQDGWHYAIGDALVLGERFGKAAKRFFS